VEDCPSLASRTLAETRRGKGRLGSGKMEDMIEMAEGAMPGVKKEMKRPENIKMYL
jgi:hypothetical protein